MCAFVCFSNPESNTSSEKSVDDFEKRVKMKK